MPHPRQVTNRNAIVAGKYGVRKRSCTSDVMRASVLLWLFFGFLVQGQTAKPKQAAPMDGFAYIFGESGTFTKLGLADARIAGYWNLAWVNPSSLKVPDCTGVPVADPACTLLFGGLQSTVQRLYGVLPTADSVGRHGSNLNFQLAKIQLPEMVVSDAISVPQPQAEWPSLVVDQSKNRLFLGYRDLAAEKIAPGTIVSVVDIYDGKTMKKMATLRESTPIRDIRQLKATPGTLIGPKAYFSADGGEIFDGLYVTAVSDNSLAKRYVNPLEKLSSEQLEVLKPFQQKDQASGKPYFNFTAGDSANGRTVVRISDVAHGQAAYWTVDLNSGETSPVINTHFGIDHLSPDGKLLLIQGAEFTKGRTESPELKALPAFWVFDVATGKQVSQFQSKTLPEITSNNELSCISPSGERLVVAANHTIAVLDLHDGTPIAEFQTASLGPLAGRCVFADR